MANEVTDASNLLMVAGECNKEENRRLLLKKIASSGNVIGLKLVRTDQVIKQFGPGLPDEQISGAVVRNTIEAKQPSYILESRNGVPLFRAITPYVVSHDFHGTDCLACHHVEVGSVNGASDVSFDLSTEFSRLNGIIIWLVIGQVVVQVLLFFILRSVN